MRISDWSSDVCSSDLKFYKPLLLFSNFMVEDEEAKDLIADLSLDIWEKRESLSIHSSVSAYLHTALKNKAINSRKRKDRNICIDEAELSNLQADSFTSRSEERRVGKECVSTCT